MASSVARVRILWLRGRPMLSILRYTDVLSIISVNRTVKSILNGFHFALCLLISIASAKFASFSVVRPPFSRS